MDVPPRFYKYVSADVARKVLSTGRIRWSSPTCFDDPAEFRRMPRFEPNLASSFPLLVDTLLSIASGRFSANEIALGPSARYLLSLFRRCVAAGIPIDELRANGGRPDADQHASGSLQRWVESLGISTARILCVTTEPNSDDMWTRYGEDSSGALLEFRHVPQLNTPLMAARPVSYSPEPAVVCSGLDFLLYGDTEELRASTYEAMFFTKNAEWSYQAEWRALTWRPEEGQSEFGDYRFWPEELSSVTCGRNSSGDFQRAVQSLVQARFAASEFRIQSASA